ncbi:MAG: hypothetical protein ACQETE_16335 [Bacteroidota bacterium]
MRGYDNECYDFFLKCRITTYLLIVVFFFPVQLLAGVDHHSVGQRDLASASYSLDLLGKAASHWVAHYDSRLEQGSDSDSYLIGTVTSWIYNKDSGQHKLRVYQTSSGDIYDIGYQLLPHEQRATLETSQQYAVQLTERMVWAIQSSYSKYTETILSDTGVELQSNVGHTASEQALWLHKEIDRSEYPLSLDISTNDEGKTWIISVGYPDGKEIALQIKPSLATVSNGQSNLYREKLIEQLTSKGDSKVTDNGLAEREEAWEHLYNINWTDHEMTWALPEHNPHKNAGKLVRDKEGQLMIPAETVKADSLQLLRHHYFWSTLTFPDSAKWEQQKDLAAIPTRWIFEENDYPQYSQSMRMSIKNVLSVAPVGTPVYYGIERYEKNEGQDSVTVTGVLNILDKDLQIEHAFRIEDIFAVQSRNQTWTWVHSSLRAVLAVRLDNVNNAFYEQDRSRPKTKFNRKFKIKIDRE